MAETSEDTKRAEEAQSAIHDSIERAHELLCEARFLLRPQGTHEAEFVREKRRCL